MQIPVNSNRLLMPIIVAQACCCLTSGQVGPENQHMSSFTILWYPLTMADVIDTKSKTHDLYVFAGCLLYSPHWCKKKWCGSKFKTWTADFRPFLAWTILFVGVPNFEQYPNEAIKTSHQGLPRSTHLCSQKAVEVALPQGENQRTQQFGVVACCRDPLRNRWAPGKPMALGFTNTHVKTAVHIWRWRDWE